MSGNRADAPILRPKKRQAHTCSYSCLRVTVILFVFPPPPAYSGCCTLAPTANQAVLDSGVRRVTSLSA